MAISNFIPTIWSETLYTTLDKQYIGVANCNRDFEGDIKEMGSVVKICGVGNISVRNYTKNSDMTTPQTLSDTAKELTINQAKYFNFQIDDIDKAQCTPKLMTAAMKLAADSLVNEADAFVYGLYEQAGSIVKNENATVDNIVASILKARTKLYEANVSNASDVVIEVTPAVAELILQAKINLATDNGAALENGCIGSIGGCKIFVSNNLFIDDYTSETTAYHKCFVRTKRAIAFAEQISQIDAYRPEKRFADAVKGLYLFGAEVIYEDEFVLLEIGLPV